MKHNFFGFSEARLQDPLFKNALFQVTQRTRPKVFCMFVHINLWTMNSLTLTIRYNVFSMNELSNEKSRLAQKAIEATHTSYAPYSRFSVGAAVLLDNGEIVQGSNQENAAFGAGTCAERCALFYANAKFPEVGVHTLAVAARGTDGQLLSHPVSPCGVCRQALIEVQGRAGHNIRILLIGANDVMEFQSASDLLPFSFDEIE